MTYSVNVGNITNSTNMNNNSITNKISTGYTSTNTSHVYTNRFSNTSITDDDYHSFENIILRNQPEPYEGFNQSLEFSSQMENSAQLLGAEQMESFIYDAGKAAIYHLGGIALGCALDTLGVSKSYVVPVVCMATLAQAAINKNGTDTFIAGSGVIGAMGDLSQMTAGYPLLLRLNLVAIPGRVAVAVALKAASKFF